MDTYLPKLATLLGGVAQIVRDNSGTQVVTNQENAVPLFAIVAIACTIVIGLGLFGFRQRRKHKKFIDR